MISWAATFKKHRLTLSFLLIIVLFLFLGIVSIREVFTLGSFTRTIYEHPLVVSNASLNAALHITKMHRGMKDVVLSDTPDELDTSLVIVTGNETVVRQQLDIIRDKILGEEGQLLEAQTRQLFLAWQPIRAEVVRHIKAGRKKAAIMITKEKGAAHVALLETKMLELTSYARNRATAFLNQAENSQSRLESISVGLTLAGVVLSALIALYTIRRVLRSESVLLEEKNKLQKALAEIKTLRGIIPICSHCKQIRDDEGLWRQLEVYMRAHSEANFSHGICPDCMQKHYA